MTPPDEMSESHDCGHEAAAYVLGALEPAEAEAFSRHLEQCAICRDEVDSLQGVVQALPMAAPQYAVPRRLRRRVLRAIREERRAQPGGSARRLRLASARPRLALAGALAAAAAGAAAFGALQLTGGPGARLIPARVAGVSGSAELRLVDGRGDLIVHRLSPPPPGQVYEVWLKAPARPPRPASVLFSVDSSGDAEVGLPVSLRGIAQVMVTAEPDGGTSVPTHRPVIVAALT
jgi:anti-sigma factor RsiW